MRNYIAIKAEENAEDMGGSIYTVSVANDIEADNGEVVQVSEVVETVTLKTLQVREAIIEDRLADIRRRIDAINKLK